MSINSIYLWNKKIYKQVLIFMYVKIIDVLQVPHLRFLKCLHKNCERKTRFVCIYLWKGRPSSKSVSLNEPDLYLFAMYSLMYDVEHLLTMSGESCGFTLWFYKTLYEIWRINKIRLVLKNMFRKLCFFIIYYENILEIISS